jgi:hypothetical protein
MQTAKIKTYLSDKMHQKKVIGKEGYLKNYLLGLL